jgi:hypothetical protein
MNALDTDPHITVDILNKFHPTHVADILTWDYTIYPPGHFDIVWCSPPCTEYSKAKTRGERDLQLADRCVQRCFTIIDYFQPRVWIVENPATGLLPRRMPTIRPGIQYYMGDYCAYGAPYRKRTAFWCNMPLTLTLCGGAGVCTSMVDNKHRGSCGNGTNTYNSEGIHSVWDKDAIPPRLIQQILTCVTAERPTIRRVEYQFANHVVVPMAENERRWVEIRPR